MSATGFQRRRRMLEDAQAVQEQPKVQQPATQLPERGPALADMTVRELRALAADKGIALGRELTAKADILAAVETALGESSAHSS